jgi:hypothetical protein
VIASEYASQSHRSRQTGSGNLLFSLGLEVPAADQLKHLGKTNPQSSREDTHPSALIVHHSSRILQFKVIQRSSGDPPGANANREGSSL